MSLQAPERILSGMRGGVMVQSVRRNGQTAQGAVVLLSLRATAPACPVSLSLLTPAAGGDFEAWAINRRVFEIAMATLSLSRP